jgi:hypothetical protein
MTHREGEYGEIMELIEDELWHDDVYTEVNGEWIEFQFEGLTFSLNMWEGIITVWDNNEKEEIYRVE